MFFICHIYNVLMFKKLFSAFFIIKTLSTSINVGQNSILMIFCIVCYDTQNRRAMQHGEIIVKVRLFYTDRR